VCVFISHFHRDKPKARELARFLVKLGADIYFDEDDALLQLADESGNELRVVACIEAGLTNCTHLLGLITPNTEKSWWVPYEIGGATGRKRECAHLIDGEVKNLPAYINAAKLLTDQKELREWLPLSPRITIAERYLHTLTNFSGEEQLSFIPEHRAKGEIKFY